MSIYFDVKTIEELIGDNYYREQKVFTLQELAQYDGRNGRPAYVAVGGIVYDVSRQENWAGGTNMGLTAGKDLTNQFNAFYGMTQMLSKLPKVGILRSSGMAGGTAGSGMAGGTAGSGMAGGTAGSGMAGGTAGSGMAGGTAGSGMAGGTAGSGMAGGTAGSGMAGGATGPGVGTVGVMAGGGTGSGITTGGTIGSGMAGRDRGVVNSIFKDEDNDITRRDMRNEMNSMFMNTGAIQDTSEFTPNDWVRYITPLVDRALEENNTGMNPEHLYQKFILSGVLVGLGKNPQEAIDQVEEWNSDDSNQLLAKAKMNRSYYW